MILTSEQIRQITVGALCVLEMPDGYHFRRFTERQVDVLLADNDRWGRNYDTTGIRLDFHTNATELVVDVASNGKYEVLVNDLTTYCERTTAPGQFTVALDGQDNRITILLPNHVEGVIRNISLENSVYCRPHEFSCKIAFYGDSITQGWNSEKDSQTYAWFVSRALNADSMNFGVGGTTFIPEFPEFVDYPADMVVVALGTNDYGRGKDLDTIRQHCTAYLQKVASFYPKSKLFCVTPTWRMSGTEVKAGGTLADVRDLISDIALSLGYQVINGLEMIPHRLEYFADQGLHPDDIGFAHYARKLCQILKFH